MIPELLADADECESAGSAIVDSYLRSLIVGLEIRMLVLRVLYGNRIYRKTFSGSGDASHNYAV